MSRALALTLAMVVLAILLATPHGGTQALDQVDVRIRWVTYINPTDGGDLASGVCVFGDYIAVVGGVGGSREGRPYVALLRKSDGGVVREWIGSEVGGFSNCISIGGKLYAVGITAVDNNNYYGLIYVFDEKLNILAKVRSESSSGYSSLAYDGKALYLSGGVYEDVDGDGWKEWVGLVEKRVLDTNLRLVSSKKIYFSSWREGGIFDIGVEPSTGRIWAVGTYRDSNYRIHSLIMIFDSDLRELRVSDYPEDSDRYLGWLTGMAFDGRHVYVLGSLGVAKFSADGKLVATNRDGRERYKIVYGYGYLYTFGEEERYRQRHVLHVHDTDLDMVKRYVLSENVRAPLFFPIGRPALEGNNIYVAGYDEALGYPNTRIVVYSLLIESVTVTATPISQTTATIATPTAVVTGTEAGAAGIPATGATTPVYTTVTITVSEGTPALLIVAGLAAVGVVLAVAFLLLKRR